MTCRSTFLTSSKSSLQLILCCLPLLCHSWNSNSRLLAQTHTHTHTLTTNFTLHKFTLINLCFFLLSGNILYSCIYSNDKVWKNVTHHTCFCCLQSNDGEERLAVVRLLAKLFGAKDSELASHNRPLWQCFLGRWVVRNPCSRRTASSWKCILKYCNLMYLSLSLRYRPSPIVH